MTTNLSQIKKVELRNIWANEAYDFTEWLMKEENISLLSDEIGIEINSVQSEADVGSFSVDDSKPAPKFNIVSKPNEWAKILKQRKDSKELSDTKVKQLNFWTRFKEYGKDKLNLSFRTPQPQNWYEFSIGISDASVLGSMNTIDNKISCVLYISGNKELFNYLVQNKGELEQELGNSLEFSQGEKDGRIIMSRSGFDLDKEDDYKDHFDWLLENLREFRSVFGEYIKRF